jgi:hypothetical protein
VLMTIPLNRSPMDESETFRKITSSVARYKVSCSPPAELDYFFQRHMIGAVKHFLGNEHVRSPENTKETI